MANSKELKKSKLLKTNRDLLLALLKKCSEHMTQKMFDASSEAKELFGSYGSVKKMISTFIKNVEKSKIPAEDYKVVMDNLKFEDQSLKKSRGVSMDFATISVKIIKSLNEKYIEIAKSFGISNVKGISMAEGDAPVSTALESDNDEDSETITVEEE